MELISTDGRISNYMGLSTEIKPTEDLATGSFFIELDTGKVYYFNEASTTWAIFGGAQ